VSSSTTKALVELLKSLFTTDELYRLATFLPHGNLVSALPSAPASLEAVAFEMVQVLQRHGWIDDAFFTRLEEERPGRKAEINRIRTLSLELERVARTETRRLSSTVLRRRSKNETSEHPWAVADDGTPPASQARVYELAREFNISNEELIANLQALGIDVINHLSPLNADEVARVKRSLERERVMGTETRRLSSTVLRRRSKSESSAAPRAVVDDGTPPASSSRSEEGLIAATAASPSHVFISYSHDSPAHARRVFGLANRLRTEGVDAWIDQYEIAPAQGWPRWMQEQIEQADFILLVCTAAYRRRFEGKEDPGQGKGVTWEGLLAQQVLYEAQTRNERLVPVLFEDEDEEAALPMVLRPYMRYRLPSGYEGLYRRLTRQPAVIAPPLGQVRAMLPHGPSTATGVAKDAPSGASNERVTIGPLPTRSTGMPDRPAFPLEHSKNMPSAIERGQDRPLADGGQVELHSASEEEATMSPTQTPGTSPSPDRDDIVNELARVFGNQGDTTLVLERAGVPLELLPPFGHMAVASFWQEVCRRLDKGLVQDGFARLVEAAAKLYPGNLVFARFVAAGAGRGAGGPGRPGEPAGEAPRSKRSGRPQTLLLHLSDLHFSDKDQAKLWHGQLAEDLVRELGCKALDALIVSGDIAGRAAPAEYEAARRFLELVAKEFEIAPQRIILVPGNHDVSWPHSEEAYTPHRRRSYQGPLVPGRYIDSGDYVEIRDEERYQERFAPFARFYEEMRGEVYPLECTEQATMHHLPEHDLLVVGFNSAWQIDHHFKARADVHDGAVDGVLERIRKDPTLERCRTKMAIWHHPVQSTQDDRIRDHGFLERLAVAGFRVALHGHIHKAENSLYRYDQAAGGRQLTCIAAGTFGAPAHAWVPGYPLQYQLLKLEDTKLTVETRRREEPGGAWRADARWSRGPGQDPLPRYNVALSG
jgi:hypothetical protein